MEEFEANGSKVTINDDGTMEIVNEAGASLKFDRDGNIQLDIENIEAIGIKSITEVISHRIMRDGAVTVHEIEFINGGSAKVAYTTEGKLKEFSCSKVGTTLTPESEIIIGASKQ